VIALVGASGGINFPAEASGGASIDFKAISGVAGVTAGAFWEAGASGAGATEETVTGLESLVGAASDGGFSGALSGGFAGAAATGDMTGAGA
jgi:hypothetical protein